eukprot:CAMPEP_0118928618 /NCGR_PEP_ID=MMETSP1169-20130426/5839_1 /TAXON_ID=36882 /ORGANISM="Pyramimonas obovata, Strain CCMP722" /LENGTH=41 /DNA_ID= /DNA_START= /DNA_END= /DNA_ORIENTATION=
MTGLPLVGRLRPFPHQRLCGYGSARAPGSGRPEANGRLSNA